MRNARFNRVFGVVHATRYTPSWNREVRDKNGGFCVSESRILYDAFNLSKLHESVIVQREAAAGETLLEHFVHSAS